MRLRALVHTVELVLPLVIQRGIRKGVILQHQVRSDVVRDRVVRQGAVVQFVRILLIRRDLPGTAVILQSDRACNASRQLNSLVVRLHVPALVIKPFAVQHQKAAGCDLHEVNRQSVLQQFAVVLRLAALQHL